MSHRFLPRIHTGLLRLFFIHAGWQINYLREMLGMTVPFVILTLVAIWLTVVLFRSLSDTAALQMAYT